MKIRRILWNKYMESKHLHIAEMMHHTMGYNSWEHCYCHPVKPKFTSAGLKFFVPHYKSHLPNKYAVTTLVR
jgi:hypothetical protein